MARLPDPTTSMNPKVQELYQRLQADRGPIDGMYRTMLNHPELTELMSAMGGYMRFGHSRLPADLRELTILWVGRKAGASYEWVKHEGHALKAGVPPEIVEALRTGQKLSGLTPLQERVLTVLQLVTEHKSIPQKLQDELISDLGIEGLIELVVLHGYYRMIAGVIFAFDVPLPPGKSDPFKA